MHFKASENDFLGIFMNHLHVQESHANFLHEETFLIQWRETSTKSEHFWKIKARENPDVHEFIVEETKTPEPFSYVTTDDLYDGQHAIYASSYRSGDTAIQSVMLSGFHDAGRTFITEIILQFQNHYIHLIAGPIVELHRHSGTYMKLFQGGTDVLKVL